MSAKEPEGPTVTAAELVRNFSRFRDMARKSPVRITHHGRETHVLSDLATYQDLCRKAAEGARGGRADDESGTVLALADWIDDGIIICDEDLRIEFANRTAIAMVGATAGALVGRDLREALPVVAGSLVEVHAVRTQRQREPSAADIPSPFRSGAWLRFQGFPLGDQVVLKFRDITEDVQRHRKADLKGAIRQAMEDHGAIGFVCTTVRGTIERVNAPFCHMMRLSPERLERVLVSELVVPADRHKLREELEASLRGDGERVLDVQFLANGGDVALARVSIVQLHGAYGGEGAVMLITQLPGSEIQNETHQQGAEGI